MDKDALYKIFSRQLEEQSNIREKAPDFIRKVAHLYTLRLTQVGSIPLQMLDEVIEEIEHQVVEMYRKKTYGFLTLEEYRRHKFRQRDDQ